jgi:hypothetical protein
MVVSTILINEHPLFLASEVRFIGGRCERSRGVNQNLIVEKRLGRLAREVIVVRRDHLGVLVSQPQQGHQEPRLRRACHLRMAPEDGAKQRCTSAGRRKEERQASTILVDRAHALTNTFTNRDGDDGICHGSSGAGAKPIPEGTNAWI